MRIDRHMYGSVSGYQTLAHSAGVAASDLRVLEGLSIGQSSDPAFHRSLAGSPAYIIHPVGSRRALTRITSGPPDDQGRPTVRRMTLILSQADWDGALQADVSVLMSQARLWDWDGEASLPALDVSLPASSLASAGVAAGKMLALLSLLERARESGGPIVLRESSLSLDEFRLLEMLVPPSVRTRHSAVYRGLTSKLPSSLICLADQATPSARGESYRVGQAVELSAYARALSEAGLGAGRLPLDVVRSYRSFGMQAPIPAGSRPQAARATMPPQVIVERVPRGMLVMFVLACVLLPLCSSFGTYALTVRRHRATMSACFDSLAGMTLPAMAKEDRGKFVDTCRTMLAAAEQHTERNKKLEALTQKTVKMDQFEMAFRPEDLLKDPNPADALEKQIDVSVRQPYDGMVKLTRAMQTKAPQSQVADSSRYQQIALKLAGEVRDAVRPFESADENGPIPDVVKVWSSMTIVAKACKKAVADLQVDANALQKQVSALEKGLKDLEKKQNAAIDGIAKADKEQLESWRDKSQDKVLTQALQKAADLAKRATEVEEAAAREKANRVTPAPEELRRQQLIERLTDYKNRIDAMHAAFPRICGNWFSTLFDPRDRDLNEVKSVIPARTPFEMFVNDKLNPAIRDKVNSAINRRAVSNNQPYKAICEAIKALDENKSDPDIRLKSLKGHLGQWALSAKFNDELCLIDRPRDLEDTLKLLDEVLTPPKVELKGRKSQGQP